MDAGPAGWGRPLYERVLDAVVGGRLLDVGCGSGQLCRLAADRGLTVTGVDADPAQLARAAALVPEATLHRADLHALPFGDGAAGAVTCVQVLMHVPNPLAALRELARVAAPGSPVAVTVWGPVERCAVGAFGAALAPLLGRSTGSAAGGSAHPRSVSGGRLPGLPGLPGSGPRRDLGGRSSGPAAPPLGAEGRLVKLAGLAGLRVASAEDVTCAFDYPDERALLAALYASELGRRALAVAGRAEVRRALLARLEPYRTGAGGYRLDNVFRLVLAHA